MRSSLDSRSVGLAAVWLAAGMLLLSLAPRSASAATQVFTSNGNSTLSIMLAFEAAIGGSDNGNVSSPQTGGFRSINWDGVKLDGTDFGGNNAVVVKGAVAGIAPNRFQTRGTLFDEIYAVSGDSFLSVNPNAGLSIFPPFSPNNIFAPFQFDNQIGLEFIAPSAATAAQVQSGVRGFGAIFINVEVANTSAIEYFNGNTSLGKFFVPVGVTGQPQFLGVLFDTPVVTRAVLTLGTSPNDRIYRASLSSAASFPSSLTTPITAGPKDNPSGGVNIVATDDFVFSEPVSVAAVITSSLSPATVTVNQPFSYTLTAVGSDVVVLNATNLPPGLSFNASTGVISGSPTQVGSFSIALSAKNNEGTDNETLPLTVSALPPPVAGSNSNIDSDGDGFPDELEIGVGTDPKNSASTPFNGAPAGTPVALISPKLSIKLSFAKQSTDTVTLSGSLAVPAGFDPTKPTVVTPTITSGPSVVVDIGGVVSGFTLDSKGNSPTKGESNTFKIHIKSSKKNGVPAQTAKYTATFKKGTFTALLTDEGLTNTTAKKAPLTVPVIILFNLTFNRSDVPVSYTARAGKTGAAK